MNNREEAMMSKRILAALMAAMMLASVSSTTVFAATKSETTTKVVTQEKKPKKKKVIKKKASSKAKSSKKESEETDWKNEMLEQINAARKKAGVSELKLDDKLCEAAQIRADECLEQYDHTRPDGRKFTTVLEEVGIKYGYWGENINEKQETVDSTMKSWMNSKGHKANILKKELNTVGFGRAKDSKGRYYWVQLFISAK